jgi:hypothetical protein
LVDEKYLARWLCPVLPGISSHERADAGSVPVRDVASAMGVGPSAFLVNVDN